MKIFRFSKKKTYKVHGFSEDGKLLATTYDSGITSRDIALTYLEYSYGRRMGHIATMTVYCEEDDSYVRYKVNTTKNGNTLFEKEY